MDTENDLRFPIGRFKRQTDINQSNLTEWIADIELLPSKLKDALSGLNERQLDTPYRPGGWTVRQVTHHFADSHLNAVGRFKLALTEDNPSITAYNEAAWAELADSKTSPVDVSLQLLNGLHARWTALLRSMTEPLFRRSVQHPENGEMRLDWMTGLYAWHSRHHVAHITALRQREKW